MILLRSRWRCRWHRFVASLLLLSIVVPGKQREQKQHFRVIIISNAFIIHGIPLTTKNIPQQLPSSTDTSSYQLSATKRGATVTTTSECKPTSTSRKTKKNESEATSNSTVPEKSLKASSKSKKQKKNGTTTEGLDDSDRIISLPTHWIDPNDEIIYHEMTISDFKSKESSASISNTKIKAKKVVRNNDNNETLANQCINSTTGVVGRKVIPSMLHFTVRGNPLPLRRHRTKGGFIYNPSATTQNLYRRIVQEQILSTLVTPSNTTVNYTNNCIQQQLPLWDIDQPIMVSILFRMKRPNSHFVGNGLQRTRKLSVGTLDHSIDVQNDKEKGKKVLRLRTSAPDEICSNNASLIRTDIDNLAKFVLDSFNNILYRDDKQVLSLHVMKLYDNDHTNDYLGSTTICIRPLLPSNNNITQIINKMIL